MKNCSASTFRVPIKVCALHIHTPYSYLLQAALQPLKFVDITFLINIVSRGMPTETDRNLVSKSPSQLEQLTNYRCHHRQPNLNCQYKNIM